MAIIVSGCPRSGTSMMMNVLKTSLGDARIVGQSLNDENLTPAVEYIRNKQNPNWREEKIRQKDMNPEGFWECKYTVQGVSYHPQNSKELADLKGSEKIFKLVSQGLIRTDPVYVSRIIFMLRNPRAVAKSQERLKHELAIDELGPVHSPEMFNRVTFQAAQWISANPDVPVLIVDYDELIENPIKAVNRVADFVGEPGDWDVGAATIQRKLRRSVPEAVESDLWGDADLTYTLVGKGDWMGIVEHFRNPTETAKSQIKFYCPRRGMPTNINICKVCKIGDPVPQFIKTCRRNGVDWEQEPCLWDVEFDPDFAGQRPTIEESIQNNHWAEFKPNLLQKMRLGDKVEKVTKAMGIKPCSGCQKRKAVLNGEVEK